MYELWWCMINYDGLWKWQVYGKKTTPKWNSLIFFINVLILLYFLSVLHSSVLVFPNNKNVFNLLLFNTNIGLKHLSYDCYFDLESIHGKWLHKCWKGKPVGRALSTFVQPQTMYTFQIKQTMSSFKIYQIMYTFTIKQSLPMMICLNILQANVWFTLNHFFHLHSEC